jgi:hypothetical protein
VSSTTAIIVAAIIAAGGSLLGAILGVLNRRSVKEVHVLVNSQLSDVMQKLAVVTGERDEARRQPSQEPL